MSSGEKRKLKTTAKQRKYYRELYYKKKANKEDEYIPKKGNFAGITFANFNAYQKAKNDALKQKYNNRDEPYVSPGNTHYENWAEYKKARSRKNREQYFLTKKEGIKENIPHNIVSPPISDIDSISSAELIRSFSGNNDLAVDPNIFSAEKSADSISSSDSFLHEFDDNDGHLKKRRKTAKSRGGRKTKKSRK